MVIKFSIGMLVAGMVAFAVYSFTSKPDFEATYQSDQSNLRAKVSSADIYPKAVYTNNTLQLKMMRATRDEYSYLDVRWFRNGQQIRGVSGPSLPPQYFRKGDLVYAEVNLLGIDAMDTPVKTTPVTVLNSPPRIVSASTALRSLDSDVLFARVNATDADREKLKITYRWFRNGVEVPDANLPVFDLGNCADGDVIYAMITASDGDDETAPYKCDPITLGSNAPMITSTPPSSCTPDRRYVYQVEVTTPSNDPLTWELVKGPKGMTLSPDGLITWKLPEKAEGQREFGVVVRVADPTGGEAFQEFTIGLSGKKTNG